jgi:hypothetical protein
MTLAWSVADHLYGAEFLHLLGGQELPIRWIGMLAVEDGLKMQVASRGGTRSAHPGNDFPNQNRVSLLDGDCLKVVVRGDQTVAVIDFHPVAATPEVPAHSPDHTGVGRINSCAAGSSEILAPMEFAGHSGQGAGTEAERRAGNQEFKWSHEGSCRRTAHFLNGHVQLMFSVFGPGPDSGAAKGYEGS